MNFYLKEFFKNTPILKKVIETILEKITNSAKSVHNKNTSYLILDNKEKRQQFLLMCSKDHADVSVCVKPRSVENTNFSIPTNDSNSSKEFEDVFFYSKVLYLNKNWETHAKYLELTPKQYKELLDKAASDKDLDALFEMSNYMLESMNNKVFMLDSYYVLGGLLQALDLTSKEVWDILNTAYASQQKQYVAESVENFTSQSKQVLSSLHQLGYEKSVEAWIDVADTDLKGEERNDADNHYYAIAQKSDQRQFLIMTSQNHDVLVYQAEDIKAVFFASHPDYGYVEGYSDYTRFSAWQYMQDYVNQTINLAFQGHYALNATHLTKGCAYLEVKGKCVYSQYSLIKNCFELDASIY